MHHSASSAQTEMSSDEAENESEYLNLDVTVPSDTGPGQDLPVFIWIHAITFCSAASGIYDTTKLVADSISSGHPFITVAPNYRLNIFGFGDGNGSGKINLSLKDQELAIYWVRRHISGFGGDPARYTFRPDASFSWRGNVEVFEARAHELEDKSLREYSQKAFQQILTENNISRLRKRGFQDLAPDGIISIFTDTNIELDTKLRKAHGISPNRPTPNILDALDFVHDVEYTLPIEHLCKKLATANKRVYRYLLDEPNPWQQSARAHYAIDLIFLCGGIDISHKSTAERVDREMRRRWVIFIHWESPWGEVSPGTTFAFGPYGECEEPNEMRYMTRRRIYTLSLSRKAGIESCAAIANALVTGSMNLLN
ncbi:putative carboxylesterase [Paecilomyces variotii]|uniref:Putative carboxylesterase n=1 Tax=Byssochlamys spectabilis TaxID=264951 RepID=A0A443HR80_BYSSP|nr:putative carboxylesterase [Paecilomyces variotii]RWQ94332.1 putative carboxylesterase [Paecilomyces variotii]